ncbi:Na(+)-translocating NADH-quinone reductase subunit A [Pontiella sulfatireligans]|uniref:Na(+)-translocating NADH-quinone reductase subunit A n=1 Tax=Pontiella sulfatireligans TaxID=2750658 RepID=A0A6C2UCP8_9BACT|nr:Na(+)-translocating NADH-quinone reductase subunit A [Pontiella sulfatireligans]VGO17958.1 Na(+)-translocating NADH-quinone reductase subunit A [Pontiella sulfatireligans]
MANFKINKGFDIKVLGKPKANIEDYSNQQLFAVYPSEFEGLKPRLKVKAGDSVKRGDVLFENKKNVKMLFRSPCCGTVTAVNLGARRFPVEILIEPEAQEESVAFTAYARDSIGQLSREQVVDHLLNAGLWPLIKQRPFNKIADPEAAPKAVFINAAGSAPFQADFSAVLKGDEEAFQTGINALAKLTEGKVHLCKSAGSDIPDFGNSESHTFSGKHPSGNTSVHINRISPILPQDTVYTIAAQDVILIGKLLNTGELPRTKVVALGGPAVKEEFRKHYRVPVGSSLKPLFEKALEGEEVRVIQGNVLWGDIVKSDTCIRYYGSEFFVLEEDRSRHLMGWTMPGLFQYSSHRVNLSSVIGLAHDWKLGTSLHGSRRAMVVTGWMDKYQPLNIMTDFLVRAALAHDTDEMIQLGILETDPEDFALAAFVDPHKTDVCAIIKRGLEEIEEEGI